MLVGRKRRVIARLLSLSYCLYCLSLSAPFPESCISATDQDTLQDVNAVFHKTFLPSFLLVGVSVIQTSRCVACGHYLLPPPGSVPPPRLPPYISLDYPTLPQYLLHISACKSMFGTKTKEIIALFKESDVCKKATQTLHRAPYTCFEIFPSRPYRLSFFLSNSCLLTSFPDHVKDVAPADPLVILTPRICDS